MWEGVCRLYADALPFSVTDLSIWILVSCRRGLGRESWNQSPVDTEGRLYTSVCIGQRWAAGLWYSSGHAVSPDVAFPFH